MIYINIGGSCVGWGSTTPDTTVNEIRFTRDGRHTPIEWNTVDMSLKNNIKMIINIDSYRDPLPRGWDSEKNLRDFTESVLNELERRAGLYKVSISQLRSKTLFILDNEADEVYPDPASYVRLLKIFKWQIAGRYKIGAGNFTFNKYYIEYLCQNGKDLFDVLCIHLQDGFETEGEIENNGNWFKNLITKYGIKRITCTEAVSTKFQIDRDYDLIISQLDKAIKIGCEDFCVIFIKSERSEINNKLVFTKSTKWDHFKNIIKYYKPKEIIVEDDDMKLEQFYYQDRPADLIKIDIKGFGIRFLRACFRLSDSNVFDAALTSEVRLYQTNKGLLVDGKVGPETFGDMIKTADFYKHYCWVHSLWARGL